MWSGRRAQWLCTAVRAVPQTGSHHRSFHLCRMLREVLTGSWSSLVSLHQVAWRLTVVLPDIVNKLAGYTLPTPFHISAFVSQVQKSVLATDRTSPEIFTICPLQSTLVDPSLELRCPVQEPWDTSLWLSILQFIEISHSSFDVSQELVPRPLWKPVHSCLHPLDKNVISRPSFILKCISRWL